MHDMRISLSVIMPTIGRPSLAAALMSVAPQLRNGDELIVVQDTQREPSRHVASLVDTARPFSAGALSYGRYLDERSVFGNAQRDMGLRNAQGSHVCFLDDDDVYRPGAIGHFHQAIEQAAHAVHVFRAEWGPGHHAAGTVLWREQAFVEGNVGTPMIVVPNARLPRWMDSNDRGRGGTTSDFGWMSAALGNRRVVWHDEIVATVRP